MNKLLKTGTGILGVLTAIACLGTVGIVGYALVSGEPEKSPEEVYQAEMQAYNGEMQEIHVLNEAVSLETPTPLYNEHIHNYTESIDIKAGCYREGKLKYTCDTCGDIYYIDVPITEHKEDFEWVIAREPTSNETGLRVKYCIYCDSIVAMEDIPSINSEGNINDEVHIHNYTVTTEREPTCVFAGLRQHTCSCGYIYTEQISALGHVASDWEVAEEATATYKGTEQRVCRVCGVLLDSRAIDALSPTESPANTAAPTGTPAQTSTPLPTNTPRPTSTSTQRPTVTPSPINTTRPTATPTARPTVTPTATPTSTPTPLKEESREIYRDENVIISYTGITGDEDYYNVNFIIENLSDRTITVQVRETSINGIMVTPICSIEVAPGKKAIDDMGIIGKDATNVPKSQVTNIETKFHIFDWNDDDFEYNTESVTIL